MLVRAAEYMLSAAKLGVQYPETEQTDCAIAARELASLYRERAAELQLAHARQRALDTGETPC